ncbi:MAG: histidine kinase [Alphaproteobacteria bacterium]|nr:histidine kinase [Alphaproteobacteria bacterium]
MALHVVLGIVALPALTALGFLLNVSLLGIASNGAAPQSWADLFGGVVVSTFYAVPTYIAVTAAGQAFVNFRNFQNRERLLARAELRALRAQIEPHFLFNTLNAISAIGYGDPKRADGAISRLSDFLRLTLKDRPPEVALKDEVVFLRTYLDIHSLLLGEKLQVAFEISDDAWDAAVPAMLLQPLVENAVVHGIGKRVSGGSVIFTAAVEGRSLALSLSNDCADHADTVKSGQGLGLQNVRDRLRLLYGDEQTFDAGPHANKFVARIAIPHRPKAEPGT